jgi:hypothetical protein
LWRSGRSFCLSHWASESLRMRRCCYRRIPSLAAFRRRIESNASGVGRYAAKFAHVFMPTSAICRKCGRSFRRHHSFRATAIGFGSGIGRNGLPSRCGQVGRCFQDHRHLPLGNRSPLKCLAKASASSGLEKQNTTTSPSSLRSAYVSGVADRTPAAQNITSLSTGARTFSAGSATRCGHLRLRSPRVISTAADHS